MKKIIFLIVVFLFVGMGFQPAFANDMSIGIVEQQPRGVTFIKTFGGDLFQYEDLGYCVQQTTDGGYIITGYTNFTYFESYSDVWLIKTDSNGNKEWDKTYGGQFPDWGRWVQQTTDGGYIITGRTYKMANMYDILLIKTDSNGKKLWEQSYGGTDDDDGFYVQQTTDGGYIITGYTQSFSKGYDDIWLIKTDSTGNKTWDKTFGDTYRDFGYCVQQTTDGGYIITGEKNPPDEWHCDVWLIKTDSTGNTMWDKTYGGKYRDCGYSVRQTTDGGYIITGFTEWTDFLIPNVLLIKTDSDGDLTWQKSFHKSYYDFGYCVEQTTDGGYIITGKTFPFGGEYNVWLIKTDSTGNKMWDRSFGGYLTRDIGYCVEQTSDGGYIITGYTESYGSIFGDVWLIKTNKNGTLRSKAVTSNMLLLRILERFPLLERLYYLIRM